jgi:hypothetical protein
MRLRSLCTATALAALLLGSGCCCFRPFHHCWRPFRCHRCGGCGCESCCSGGISDTVVSNSPGPGCDCGGGPTPIEPPVIIRPTPIPGGSITPMPGGPITPMPPASSSITPVPGPGPGPLSRNK